MMLNLNGMKYTAPCIESLKKVLYPNFDIWVIDNGSTDNSVRQLKKIKGINLAISKENLGFAEGNNVLIRKALSKGADYILLLNNDTIVKPDFLSELVRVAESSIEIGIVGPKIFYMEPKDLLWFAGAKVNYFKGDVRHIGSNQKDSDNFNKVISVDYITGCAMLVKREVFEKIGYLDNGFFIYYEEADFNQRARMYKRVYVPSSVIWHKVSATCKPSSPFMLYLNFRNRMLFMRKNAPWYSWFTFPLFYLKDAILVIIYRLAKGQIDADLAVIRGLRDGITGKQNVHLYLKK